MAGRFRVGLVADPDFPQTTAEWLAEKLPEVLSDEYEWHFEVEVDPVAAGQQQVLDILHEVSDLRSRREWDYAVCVTDLPLRRERHPVLAEVNRDEGVAVVSLPALGGLQPRRRARQLTTQVLEELTAGQQAEEDLGESRRQLQSRLTRVLAPINRIDTSTEQGEVGVRYEATRKRGRARLLTGMVRTNRPWGLIFGMSSALAAAVATSAFGLSSSTIWQIAYQLSALREVLAAVVSVGVLVGWLIAAHHLWENASAGTVTDREQARLYNASTVATLTIGVATLYLGLFVINLAVAAFLVPLPLIASTVSPEAATPSTYFALAWGFTTMGVIAGALGSSLESDQAVRQAAYGYREQQRRSHHAQEPTESSEDRTEAAEAHDEHQIHRRNGRAVRDGRASPERRADAITTTEQKMQYEQFLAQVSDYGGPSSRDHADAAAKQILAALGQRLAGREPHELASQLPPELQDPLLRHTSEAEIGDDLDDFLRRVAEREGHGCDPEQAFTHARAVLGTIASFVSESEIQDLRSQLPAGYAPLFEPPTTDHATFAN